MGHGRYEVTHRDPTNKALPAILRTQGAVLQVEIAPSLFTSSVSPLALITGLGAVDTGATITAIDRRVFAALGLSAIESRDVSTPSGMQVLEIHRIHIRLTQVGLELELPMVAAIDLSGGKVAVNGVPQDIIALIGRDILERCVFTYNGPAASFSLSVPEEIS